MKQFFKKSWFTTRSLGEVWPVFILLGIVILLFVANYRPGTILSGWDNLHPEFDFALNIRRSIFAVWQEYQGLGLLGGMAHATDFLRQLFLLSLSVFMPTNILRYFWTFLMLFVGATGAYFFIRLICHPERNEGSQENFSTRWRDSSALPQNDKSAIPFLGATFYLLNLATMQMFYVPFESFIGFFGFLPWVLLSSILYFQRNTRKRLIFLVLTLLLATPAWYLQTLFVVFMMALSIMLLPFLNIRGAHRTSQIQPPTSNLTFQPKKFLLRISKLYGIIFLINSFWLLPAIYFTTTNSQVNINSKINQMATETIFLQNKEFGTLPDVALLKGFMFKGIDPNYSGEITYMLAPWIEHLDNPLVTTAGFLLFFVVFLGFIKAIKSKNVLLKGVSLLFIFSFVALAIDTFPFSFINNLLRDNITILNQIFRFPFTKFATLASLVYAILFAIGIKTLLSNVHLPSSIYFPFRNYSTKNHPINGKWGAGQRPSPPASGEGQGRIVKNGKFISSLVVLVVPVILLILFTLPAFRGHLFYEKERAIIPSEYKQLFDFFKKQDPNTRIANFPQSNFWGWSFYEWPSSAKATAGKPGVNLKSTGYSGSGFLWYGIKQPILDRAFDVWSGTNENYYFEVTQALYSKNISVFEKVLSKYQISWILIDRNLFDAASGNALFVKELEDMLRSSTIAKKEASFGKLAVYKIALPDQPKNHVFLNRNLPIVNEYKWGGLDQAYQENGNYMSLGEQLEIGNLKLDIRNSYLYPFRTLFTLKSQKEKEFSIKEEPATIEFTTMLPLLPGKELKNQPATTLVLPPYSKNEKIIPVHIKTYKTQTGAPRLEVKVLLPQVIVGDREIQKGDGPVFNIQIPSVNTQNYPLTININGANYSPISNADQDVGVAFLTLNQSNSLTVSDNAKKGVAEVIFPPESFSSLQNTPLYVNIAGNAGQVLTVRFPKIDAYFTSFYPTLSSAEKVQNCDNFKSRDFSSKVVDNKALILEAKGATACTAFFAQNLPHNQAYAIFIKSKNKSGQPLRFWVENTDQKSIPIDTYLPKDKKQQTNSFILPPMEEFGNSYAFHFYNSSIGREKTINEINSLSAYPVFYNYLRSIRLTSDNTTTGSRIDAKDMRVTHPNESLYVVSNLPELKSTEQTTLVLSQSYNKGWKTYKMANGKWQMANGLRYAFPFIFGKEVKEHVMVNNWANGWVLDNSQLSSLNSQLVIVYLPQYLQYLGFGLLLITFAFLIFNANIRLRKKKNYE